LSTANKEDKCLLPEMLVKLHFIVLTAGRMLQVAELVLAVFFFRAGDLFFCSAD